MEKREDMTRYLTRLLSFSSSGEEFSKNLIDELGDVGRVFKTGEITLRNVEGASDKSVEFINLIAAVTQRRITDKFKIGKKYLQNDIKEYLIAAFICATVEQVCMLMFDKNDKLIAIEYISDGTVNASGFSTRKMMDAVVKHKASSVILAHNHPRGMAEPSNNDLLTTSALESVFLKAGVKLIAHYVVAETRIFDCLPLTK